MELMITREFNAPATMVFKAWAEAERLAQWWGPKGFKIDVTSFNFTAGGKFHYCLSAGAGFEMWGLFVYQEIIDPERVVFVNSFSDKDGNVVRAPFSQTWPMECINTLTLTENEGKTTLTLKGGPINATEEERETFEMAFANIETGFAGTFEQLENYLATQMNII